MLIKHLTACLLLPCVTGCSLLPEATRSQASQGHQPLVGISISATDLNILKGIPKADVACVRPEPSAQSDFAIRKIIAQQTAMAFASERFNDLEEDHRNYLQSKARTPAGSWKLDFFYVYILPSELINQEEPPEELWDEVEAKILRWIEAYPESPAAYITYSTFLSRYAWHLRSGGDARTVSPEAFQQFDEVIRVQRSVLEKSKEFAASDPNWYVNMLSIAKAQSWDRSSISNLLREGLSKEPYYYETYSAAFSYLLPKWYGSDAEAKQFAIDASAITHECEGRSIYARIYWEAFLREGDFKLYPMHSVVRWQDLSAGFEDLLTRYPEEWNTNGYALFACMARDEEKARKLLPLVGHEPIQALWSSLEIDFYSCQDTYRSLESFVRPRAGEHA